MAALQDILRLKNKQKAAHALRFFKTGPGEYGEGDQFLGLTVPQVRALVKKHAGLSLPELRKLLKSPWHEVRLFALLVMVSQYQRARTASERRNIAKLYQSMWRQVNNWDLVDSSAEKILGPFWLETKEKKAWTEWVKSPHMWRRRIAIIATFAAIKQDNPKPTLKLAALLRKDKEDLMHKAVGWMLREVGKRCGEGHLTQFLDKYAGGLPRTMLRYAIERLPPEMKQYYMKLT